MKGFIHELTEQCSKTSRKIETEETKMGNIYHSVEELIGKTPLMEVEELRRNWDLLPELCEA